MDLVTIVWHGVLVLAFALTGARYASQRHPESRDVFLMFATLMGLVVAEWAQVVAGEPVIVANRLSAFLLLAHPYAMLRVVDHLQPVPSFARRAILAGLAIGWISLALVGSPRPEVFTLSLALGFVVAEAYVASLLVKGARSSAGATRTRLWSAALGTILLGGAIFVAIGSGFVPVPTGILSSVLSGMVLIGFGAFYAGFAPPRRLTKIWDLRTLHRVVEKGMDEEEDLEARVDASIQRFLAAVHELMQPEAYVLLAERETGPELLAYPDRLEVPGPEQIQGPLLEACREEKTSVQERDITQAGAWAEAIGDRVGADALLVVPIARKGSGHGVCIVFMRRLPLFVEQTASFLELLGEDVAGALAFETVALEREKQRVEALRREKQALEEADRLKDEFLATMSHEIRTPLNAVLGMAEILQGTDLDDEQEACLDTIEASGDHLLAIIDDILNLSKIRAGHLELNKEPVVLVDVIEACMSIAAERAGDKPLELSSSIDPAAPERVLLDPDRVRQVLTNLLTNAVKFTDQGRVSLHVETGPASASPRTLLFHVEDTGPGIPPDKQADIFEPFQQADASTTREHEGTGLGLAICKRLVSHMQGRIHLSSEPGEGTTFTVEIPVELPDREPKAASPGQPLPQPRPGTERRQQDAVQVLLVEDNKVNRLVAETMLTKLGHTPTSVASGQAALDALQKQAYDVVLLDIQMPGMDGFEVAQRIRAQLPPDERPWITALSAHAGPSYHEKATQAGMDSYLVKPVSKDALEAEIQQASSAPAPPDAATRSAHEEDPPTPVAHDAPAPVEQVKAELSEDGFRRLVATFKQEAPELLHRLQEAASHRDVDAIQAHAHTLKGIASTAGAQRLAEHADTLHQDPEALIGGRLGPPVLRAALDQDLDRLEHECSP